MYPRVPRGFITENKLGYKDLSVSSYVCNTFSLFLSHKTGPSANSVINGIYLYYARLILICDECRHSISIHKISHLVTAAQG